MSQELSYSLHCERIVNLLRRSKAWVNQPYPAARWSIIDYAWFGWEQKDSTNDDEGERQVSELARAAAIG